MFRKQPLLFCSYNKLTLRRVNMQNLDARRVKIFADGADKAGILEMARQANIIASWGSNVYVKIPVMNTRGEPSYGLIRRLSKSGVKLNVTALMTLEQVREGSTAL